MLQSDGSHFLSHFLGGAGAGVLHPRATHYSVLYDCHIALVLMRIRSSWKKKKGSGDCKVIGKMDRLLVDETSLL